MDSSHSLFVIIAASFVGITSYLLAVWFVFASKGPAGMALIGFFFVVMFTFEYQISAAYVIISYTLQLIVAGILACAISWKLLDGDTLARRFCGEHLLGFADTWNTAKTQKYWQRRLALRRSGKSHTGLDRAGDFFVARMKACSPLGGNRHVLGNLYVISGRYLGPWWWMWMYAASLLAAAVGFGYMGDTPMANLLFIFPVFGTAQVDLIPHRSILLSSGRTEKYYSAVVSGFAVTFLAAIAVAMVAAMTIPLSMVMPDLSWEGTTYTFHFIDPKKSYLVLILMPIVLLVATLFANKRILTMAVTMIAVAMVMLSVPFGLRLEFSFPTTVLIIAGMIAASWAGFVLILGHYCRKRCLVGQGR